jgi:CubicO group peptidase (beta-lactamase class C family)
MMLQDEGKLSVDDFVGKYIPELADLKMPSGKPAKLTLKAPDDAYLWTAGGDRQGNGRCPKAGGFNPGLRQ